MMSSLKRNMLLRTLLHPVLLWKRGLVRRQWEIIAEITLGGEYLVAPKNIPGKFFISSKSHLIQQLAVNGSYEPSVTKVIRESALRPNGDCLNIGANIGLMSIFMAGFPGIRKVLAVEPNQEALEMLERNIKINNFEGKISVLRKCVGADQTDVVLHSIPGKSEYSSIDGIHDYYGKGQSTISAIVKCDTMDGIVRDSELRPSIIIIDTEGAEHLVFSGSEWTLRTYRPVLVFELSGMLLGKFGKSVADVLARVKALGYVTRSIGDGSIVKSNRFHGEVIALPQ